MTVRLGEVRGGGTLVFEIDLDDRQKFSQGARKSTRMLFCGRTSDSVLPERYQVPILKQQAWGGGGWGWWCSSFLKGQLFLASDVSINLNLAEVITSESTKKFFFAV